MTEKIKNYQKDFTSFFYRSFRDAQNNTNRIDNPESYENDGTTEELFIKILSGEGCETITNFFIETLNNTPITETPIYTCDETDAISNNGIGRFDLGTKESEIRANQNIPASSKITFYTSLQNAQTKTSTLPLFYKSESGQIWFRIENKNKDCGGIGNFSATVNSGINANIEETYTLCNSNLTSVISLDGGASNESWEWRDSSGTLISSQQFIELENPGNYSLLVSKTQNNLTCNKTIDFTIQEPPVISFKELRVENNQIIIAIEGGSTYDYSLDGIRFVGSGKDHVFQQVEPGLYTVYVKDKYDCETPVSEKIAFVGYPKFFTPNNDGINDIWKVKGISYDFYDAADISIYDRFGNLLHTMDLNSNEVGWDGTYKGKKLMTNDYWFKVILTDKDNQKIVNMDHFTLKN